MHSNDKHCKSKIKENKINFGVQKRIYKGCCQLMSASCHRTALRLNWTPSSWCNCRPAMFLIAPLHCFHLLLFGFLLCTTAVLTTSRTHTWTHTPWCIIARSPSWHLYWMKM